MMEYPPLNFSAPGIVQSRFRPTSDSISKREKPASRNLMPEVRATGQLVRRASPKPGNAPVL